MNETEAIHYSRVNNAREAAREFARQGCIAVIKMGKNGAAAAEGKDICEVPGFQVHTVDTTGAGDSFNAGFIYGFLNKKSLHECLLLGNGCGALSVTALGGNSGFPDKQELMAFLDMNTKTKNY